MKTVRTIIVDDEPLARKRLVRLLREHPDVEIVAECRNGREAVAAIQQWRPELVFLDIQMPGWDGFEVIQRVGSAQMPAVVFVTAYAEHAIRAFEVNALDYLLKPYDAQRLSLSLQRVPDPRRSSDADRARLYDQLLVALRREPPASTFVSRLLVKSQGGSVLLRVDEVDWIEAAGKYVRLHSRRGDYLLRQAIGELARSLDPYRFVRIHRSTLVNLDSVREFQPSFHGEWKAILVDGRALTVSRRHRIQLRDIVKSSE